MPAETATSTACSRGSLVLRKQHEHRLLSAANKQCNITKTRCTIQLTKNGVPFSNYFFSYKVFHKPSPNTCRQSTVKKRAPIMLEWKKHEWKQTLSHWLISVRLSIRRAYSFIFHVHIFDPITFSTPEYSATPIRTVTAKTSTTINKACQNSI